MVFRRHSAANRLRDLAAAVLCNAWSIRELAILAYVAKEYLEDDKPDEAQKTLQDVGTGLADISRTMRAHGMTEMDDDIDAVVKRVLKSLRKGTDLSETDLSKIENDLESFLSATS